MAKEVLLPCWDAGVSEGKVLRWLKQEGEPVEEGEPLVEVESAKVVSEVEAPASGTLARILVPEGATAPLGAVLAVIVDAGERVAGLATPGRPAIAPSPALDLPPLTGLRKTIAQRMAFSARTMAMVTLTSEADVTEMVRLRDKLVDLWRPLKLRPMYQDLIIKAVARALRDHPHMNAVLDDQGLHIMEEVNIGVATALKDGLVVPVVHHADRKGLVDIAREVRELAVKARDGRLAPQDIQGGSFTVTNLGAYEIDAFTPIINPPQIAILGIGRVVEKPVVYGGQVARRFMSVFSITFDHRAVDGAPTAQFLQSVKRYLEEPGWMVE